MYKASKGIDKISWVNNIDYNSTTRGHNNKIIRETFSSRLKNDYSYFVNVRHNFFTNRVAPIWNALPCEVVSANTLNTFKNSLDNFLAEKAAIVD